MSGYHVSKITKGVFGELSKIEEEFLELKDAYEQQNPIMVLCECADLIGAIEGFAKKWNISLDQVLKMKEVTARVFQEGTRR